MKKVKKFSLYFLLVGSVASFSIETAIKYQNGNQNPSLKEVFSPSMKDFSQNGQSGLAKGLQNMREYVEQYLTRYMK